MAGQDLLDQRASRSWHADHEDRRRRGITHPPKTLERGGVERIGNRLELAARDGFIVVGLAALQGVSQTKMLERLAVIADVFQGFAQRKVDVDHFAGGQTIRVGGEPFEIRQIGIAGAKRFQVRTIVMGFGVVGLQRDGQAELLGRLVELALLDERVRQILVWFGQIGTQGQGLLIMGRGPLELPLLLENAAEIVVGFGEIGPQRESALELGCRAIELALKFYALRRDCYALGQVGLESNCLSETVQGLVELPLPLQDAAQVVVRSARSGRRASARV